MNSPVSTTSTYLFKDFAYWLWLDALVKKERIHFQENWPWKQLMIP